MSQRTVAIRCPEHHNCVAVFMCVSDDELNGRKPLRLSYAYTAGKVRADLHPVEVRHEPAGEGTGVFNPSLDQRLDELESFAKRTWLKRRAWRRMHGRKN